MTVLKIYKLNDSGLSLLEEWVLNGNLAQMVFTSSGTALYYEIPPYANSPQRMLVPGDGDIFLTGYCLLINSKQFMQAVITNDY